MPEQLTKHPDVTLQVLRSAGAQCGNDVPQAILKQCPAERFCKLPGGELCVYGLPEAPQMTQLTASDWQAVQEALQAPRVSAESPFGAFIIGGTGFLVGVALGLFLKRRYS